ncbi:MAG: 4Fe-4S dicluster domain-containing protein [Firmicutes bacterium]|jgi:ferredoxin|nr:4Fe-4S dicluster domain-containing protein [Bacillota bacterium]
MENILAGVATTQGIDELIKLLLGDGYQVIGPSAENNVIQKKEITSVEDLPKGYTDSQAPGHYALKRDSSSPELFSWAVGPASFKDNLFPSKSTLFEGKITKSDVSISQKEPFSQKVCFFGIRPCEVAAMAVLGRVMAGGPYQDPQAKSVRENSLVIAVECGYPAENCFCTSFDTGPMADEGCDIIITEITEGEHRFLLRSGSDTGHHILNRLNYKSALPEDVSARDRVIAKSISQIGKSIDAENTPSMLARNLSSHVWSDIARRCLSCGNCTMVCPTCFCASFEHSNGLENDFSVTRRWDSCFDTAHSYIHGGSVRTSTASKYRQWMTHKLSTWVDQFNEIGCVGCGRCITWCPVGIDITEEVAKIAESESK